jgi:hypothetical protein
VSDSPDEEQMWRNCTSKPPVVVENRNLDKSHDIAANVRGQHVFTGTLRYKTCASLLLCLRYNMSSKSWIPFLAPRLEDQDAFPSTQVLENNHSIYSIDTPLGPEFINPQTQVRENIDPTYRMPVDYTSWTTLLAQEFNDPQTQVRENIDPTYCMPVDYTSWTTLLAQEFNDSQTQVRENIDPTYCMPVDYTSWTTLLAQEINDPQTQVRENIDPTYGIGYTSWTPILEIMEYRKETRAILTLSDISAVSSPPHTGELLQAFMLGHQDIKALPQEEFNLSTTNTVAGGKVDLLLKPLATASIDGKTKRPHKPLLSLEFDGELDQRLGRKEYRTDNDLDTQHASGFVMLGDQVKQTFSKISDDSDKNRVSSTKGFVNRIVTDYSIEDKKDDSDSRPAKRRKS